MASPFSIFRRHQGVLLAVFGVAIMVAFVVLPSVIQLQQISGGGGGYSSDAVMTWTGGEVTDADVRNRMQRRRMVLDFLGNLQEAAANRPGGEDMNRSRDGGMIRRLSNNSRVSAIETMLLAQKARDMGLSVSDNAIRAFLHNVTDDSFTQDGELDAAISMAMEGRTTKPAIFDALREEMYAQHVLMMGFGGTVTTPSEAWEYYNRLNRRVSAEFVAFKTSDYVTSIPEPSSSEISKFFDEHKLQTPSLISDEPGFKIPRKVQLYYVGAVYDDFLQAEKARIPNAEVAAYYEENKDDFKIEEVEFPVDEFDPDDPRNDEPSPPVVPEGDDSEGNQTDGDDAGEATDDASNEDGEAEESGGCDDEETTDAETTDEADATETTEDTSETEDNGESEDNTEGTEESGTSGDDLTLPEPKYKPLQDVDDEIRGKLAGPVAQEKFAAAVAEIKKAIEAHYEKLLDHELDDKEDPGVFDGKALAEKLGLEHGTTGLTDVISLYEKRDEMEIVQSSVGFGPQAAGFLPLAFAESRLKYQPIETKGGDPEIDFIAWKVAEEEARVPELDEIKEEVIAAWKTQQAREPAKADAEKLAAGLKGDQPLKDQIGGDHEVIAPAAFSYFDPLSVMMMRFQGQAPRPGTIGEGIEDDNSDAIKKEVINMPVGTVRVVSTADKSIYYVVRVASDDDTENADPTVKSARDKFMQDIVDAPGEGLPFLLQFVGSGDKRQTFFQWYEQIEEEYEVQRIKPEYFQEFDG